MTHFWQTKSLSELTSAEWESLCDHCGQCCLHKLEDEDTEQIAFTSIACDLLDVSSCRCTNYAQRQQLVPECVNLKQHEFADYQHALPVTCAYRLLGEGKELYAWHPLLSGDPNSVKAAGLSVSDYAQNASAISANADYEDYIIAWQD